MSFASHDLYKEKYASNTYEHNTNKITHGTRQKPIDRFRAVLNEGSISHRVQYKSSHASSEGQV